MRRKRLWCLALVAAVACLLEWPASAQRQYYELQRLWNDIDTNRRPPAGTEFIFARVRYNTLRASRGFRDYRGLEGWAHDYPEAEEHILAVTQESTALNVNKMSYVIVDLDDEELFNYPFAYFSEVGEMELTDREIANFREFFNRGGFAMIDDFDGKRSLDWFAAQMQRVFPNRAFVELKGDHPLFHTFYEIPTIDFDPPYEQYDGGRPKFYGYYDEQGRLCMIINHDNDLGDYWEWIDQPQYPLQPSIESLRFGVNYFLYSLTH